MVVTPNPLPTVMTAKVCDALKGDEGYKQFPYRDPRGVLTIGYGFNLESDGLVQAEASAVLALRVNRRYLELITALPWVQQLDEVRQGVLLNMAYNLGVRGLQEFKCMLLALQAGDFGPAADDMLLSRWAGQVGDRAQRLATQMRSGVWQR